MLRFLKRWRHGNDLVGPGVPGTLTGHFDIRGENIIGFVDRVFHLTDDGVEVIVRREGMPIARCNTEPDRGTHYLHFTMPMLGRFSPAEFVTGLLKVTIATPRGDTGILVLNGATELELIRAQFGVPVEPIIDLDFTRAGNARPYLGKGWWAAEDNYTWTIDDDSLIHFPRPTMLGPCLLRMRYSAFVKPHLPIQSMNVHLNDTSVAEFTSNSVAQEFREFRFDASPFNLAPAATLRLNHPHADRRSEHEEVDDHRRLAFAFRHLSLVRLVNPDE